MLVSPVRRRIVVVRQAGHDARAVAGADLGAVLVVGDVAQCSRSSIAPPPVIHQGIVRPDSNEPTARTGSKPTLWVVFIRKLPPGETAEPFSCKRS
jgi:hypothetical protein